METTNLILAFIVRAPAINANALSQNATSKSSPFINSLHLVHILNYGFKRKYNQSF